MFWQIESKYYWTIVDFNYKKKIIIIFKCIIRNSSSQREIIVDADTNEGRDIPRYDAWKLARVVAWACVKHRVEGSPCLHSPSVLFERPFTILARYILSSIHSCIYDNFLLIFSFINRCSTFLYNNINLSPDIWHVQQ